MTRRYAVLALLLSIFVPGQSAVPETPAGRVLTAWLAAFNSAEPAMMRTFDESYPGHVPPFRQLLGFRERTGGFTLLRIEKSEPSSIVALLQEKLLGHGRPHRTLGEPRGAAENPELDAAGHSPSSGIRTSADDGSGRAVGVVGARRGGR